MYLGVEYCITLVKNTCTRYSKCYTSIEYCVALAVEHHVN